MRTAITAALLWVMLLQGCTTPGENIPGEKIISEDSPATEEIPVAYTPQEGLSTQQRFREVLNLLAEGQPLPARAELMMYLDQNPGSDVGKDLLKQIDLSTLEYFPEDYREVQLAPGKSLSTLSKQYLGSIYQFYALAKYNGIAEPQSMQVGQIIRIPLTAEAKLAFTAQDSAVEPPVSDTTAPVDEVEDLQDDVIELEIEQPALQSEPEPTAEPQPETPLTADVAQLHRDALNAYRAQDLDKAIELWDQVLIIDPGHESARLYRAQALELQTKLRNLL